MSAAVLLGGLCVAQSPVRGYVATVTIERRVARGSQNADESAAKAKSRAGSIGAGVIEGEADDVRAKRITSHALLQLLTEGLPAQRLKAVAKIDAADGKALRGQLRIDMGGEDTPWESSIVVRGAAATPNQATQLARVAGQELAAILDDRTGRQATRRAERFTRWEVREMRHYETRARNALEEFLADWRPESKPVAAKETASARDTASADQAGATQDKSVSRRASAYVVAEPAGVEQAGASDLDGPSSDAPVAAYDTWQALRENYENAVARRKQVEQENESALYQLVAQTRTVQSWHFTLPKIVDRIGGDVPRDRIGWTLLLAAGSGVGMFWLAGRRGRDTTFHDAAEVQAATSLPVLVGVGSDDLQAVRMQRPTMHRWSWAVTLVAELIVVAFLVTLEIDLCLGRPLASEFLSHPWEVPGNLVMRIVEAWTA